MSGLCKKQRWHLDEVDDGVDAFWSAMASLKTVAGHYKYSTISKLMKTFLLL